MSNNEEQTFIKNASEKMKNEYLAKAERFETLANGIEEQNQTMANNYRITAKHFFEKSEGAYDEVKKKYLARNEPKSFAQILGENCYFSPDKITSVNTHET